MPYRGAVNHKCAPDLVTSLSNSMDPGKPYEPPELVCFGDIEELTEGAGGQNIDGFGGSQ